MATRWFAAGFGLLAMVITVAIMAVLAAKVLSSTEGSVGKAMEDKVTGTVSTSASIDVETPVAEAQRLDCEIKYRALETAVMAYEASLGKPPASEAELLASGMLTEELPGVDLQSGGGAAVVVFTDECADFSAPGN